MDDQAGPVLHDLGEHLDPALLERAYHEVLVPSFPPSELVPLAELEGGLAGDPRNTDVVVAVRDGEVVGTAVGDWDPDAGVYLLSYLAVRPGLRGGGVGTGLMAHVRSWWEARRAPVALAEVDDPRAHEAGEHGDPVARLRFYERLGAQVLGVPYVQPEIRPGSGRVPGMLLIAFAVAPEARTPAGDLRPEVLHRFLAGYLVLAEGVAEHDLDAAVHDLVPALRALSDGVPLLPMARHVEI